MSETTLPAKRTTPKKSTTVDHDILGESFKLNTKINPWLAIEVQAEPEDTATLYRFIIGLVSSEDRQRFRSYLARQENLDMEELGKIFTGMMQAVSGENPTSTSSGSPRSAKSTGGSKASVAR